jgi:transcriptional regulator with XRE-family HTH domain
VAKRDELAAELAAARSLVGISGRQMGKLLDVNHMTPSRIERGQILPTAEQTLRWLDAAGADDTTRERVMLLLNAAHAEAPTWSRRFRGRTHLQGDVAERERQTIRKRDLQTQVIPGLLQTEEYARALMRLVDMTGEVDVEESVAARLARQRILWEPGRRWEFLIAESVLKWEPEPGEMHWQRVHLDYLSSLETVRIGVVPSAARLVTWSPFVIHDLVDGSRLVTLELNHGPLEVHRAADVAFYERLWERFAGEARPWTT